MKTIVSVTPIAVASDSRTYKIAASFSRFGYKSIVIEGLKSDSQSSTLPFELLCVKGEIVFTKTNKMSAGFSKPVRFILEQLQAWFLRLTKPFSNQWRTFQTLPKASLYYLHSFYQFPAVFLKSKLSGAPYIYDAHDFYSEENSSKLNVWLEAQCIKYAFAVITVSNGVAKLIQKEFDCEPIVVRNCHDMRLDQPPPQGLRKVLNLSENDFVIMAVGQAKEGMLAIEALEAMRGLPAHVHFVFLGRNSQSYVKAVQRVGLTSRVHLLPPVPPVQVVPFISSADVSIILYYSYTQNFEYSLPNKFFQSIAAKLPLLYPPLAEMSRLAEDYRLGILIDPKSPESIKRSVMQYLENGRNPYKENLSKACQALSWEREEIILHTLLEQTFANQVANGIQR